MTSTQKHIYFTIAIWRPFITRDIGSLKDGSCSAQADNFLKLYSHTVEVAAYRIVLEAFTNVVRHAQATSCNIQIHLKNHVLLLAITDNGKGLSTENRAGIGLTSIRERAEELGGKFTIFNNSTGGVTVHARLPIGKE